MNIFRLEAKGQTFEGWKSATATHSIKEAASSFSLNVTEKWQFFGKPWKINAGDECKLYVDDTAIITGFVDKHQATLSGSDHTVCVSGRAKTGDIIDSSAIHPQGNFQNQNIKQIANKLCADFDVNVKIADGVILKTIKRFELNQGEKVFQALNRIANKQGLLLSCDYDGDLLITTATTKSDKILLSSFLSGSVSNDFSKRHSCYKAKAQQRGENISDPLEAAQVRADITDDDIKRYRPLIIRPEGSTNPSEAKERIEWHKNRNIAEALKAEFTLQGYYNPNGKLWKPNTLIYAVKPELNLANELLIESVVFEKSSSGSITKLTCVHPDALKQEPVKTSSSKKKRNSGYFNL